MCGYPRIRRPTFVKMCRADRNSTCTKKKLHSGIRPVDDTHPGQCGERTTDSSRSSSSCPPIQFPLLWGTSVGGRSSYPFAAASSTIRILLVLLLLLFRLGRLAGIAVAWSPSSHLATRVRHNGFIPSPRLCSHIVVVL